MPSEVDYQFGKTAVARGFLKQEQLEECIEVLVALERAGSAKRLWEVVARKGYMDIAQIAEVRRDLPGGESSPVPVQPIHDRRDSPAAADHNWSDETERHIEEELGWDVSLDIELEKVDSPLAKLGIEPLTETPDADAVRPGYKPGELRLTCVQGSLEGESFMLDSERTVIGRDATADVVLKDPSISRHHAEISFHGQQVVVRDLNSRNGIRVNAVRVPEAVLQPGETVRIGHCLLMLQRI